MPRKSKNSKNRLPRTRPHRRVRASSTRYRHHYRSHTHRPAPPFDSLLVNDINSAPSETPQTLVLKFLTEDGKFHHSDPSVMDKFNAKFEKTRIEEF